MNRTIKRFLTVALMICGGCLCITLVAGCKNTTRNQQEWGFRWGNEFTIFSRAAQTAPEEATVEITSQPLLDWLAKPAEPEVSVVPVTPVPEPVTP